jgi:PTH2 family peptidyl-tRNA hydrolase
MKKDVKQVIVLRKFPNMRTGKYASQAAHASMGVFFKSFLPVSRFEGDDLVVNHWEIPALEYFQEYINGSFKKIVVYVETEEELLDIYHKAEDVNIHCSLIQDAGLTEFGGVPTYTAVGIGPWDSKELNEITGHLPLF